MNDPKTTPPLLRNRVFSAQRSLDGRTSTTSPRSLGRISRLPPSLLRSAMPGYLLAATVALGLSGWVGWKVTRQSEAIRAAEARTPAPTVVEAPLTPPSPVLVALPPEATASPLSRVETTGAIVAAPSATSEHATPQSLPVPPVAPASTSVKTTTAEPASPRTETVRVRHARPTETIPAPARPTRARHDDPSPTDDNPYASDRASAPAPSATATPDSDHVFDVRE